MEIFTLWAVLVPLVMVVTAVGGECRSNVNFTSGEFAIGGNHKMLVALPLIGRCRAVESVGFKRLVGIPRLKITLHVVRIVGHIII